MCQKIFREYIRTLCSTFASERLRRVCRNPLCSPSSTDGAIRWTFGSTVSYDIRRISQLRSDFISLTHNRCWQSQRRAPTLRPLVGIVLCPCRAPVCDDFSLVARGPLWLPCDAYVAYSEGMGLDVCEIGYVEESMMGVGQEVRCVVSGKLPCQGT